MTDVSPRTIQAVEAELTRLRWENAELRAVVACIADYPVGFDWDAAKVMQGWAQKVLAAAATDEQEG